MGNEKIFGTHHFSRVNGLQFCFAQMIVANSDGMELMWVNNVSKNN